MAVESDQYIPKRLLDQMVKEICRQYGLADLELHVTCPEAELHKIEPEELRDLFVSRNSMTRGSLAGALWIWEGTELTVKLTGNGKGTGRTDSCGAEPPAGTVCCSCDH